MTCFFLGNITAGLPPFQIPPFYIENDGKTFDVSEICSNLGSALGVVPLIGILESVAIAKSFGKPTTMFLHQTIYILCIYLLIT